MSGKWFTSNYLNHQDSNSNFHSVRAERERERERETTTMLSCQSSVVNSSMFAHKFHLRDSAKFRCILLRQISPKFAVISSSLSSVITSPNVIAAAAASTSGSLHGAVSSTITQVAVTAVAIASGACLSTKVDFLWPKLQDQPGSIIFYFVNFCLQLVILLL